MSRGSLRWDGTQAFDEEEVEDSELMDEISDELLSGTSPSRALQRLLRRGISGRIPGLDDLSKRIAEARRRWAEQTNTNSAVSSTPPASNRSSTRKRPRSRTRRATRPG